MSLLIAFCAYLICHVSYEPGSVKEWDFYHVFYQSSTDKVVSKGRIQWMRGPWAKIDGTTPKVDSLVRMAMMNHETMGIVISMLEVV